MYCWNSWKIKWCSSTLITIFRTCCEHQTKIPDDGHNASFRDPPRQNADSVLSSPGFSCASFQVHNQRILLSTSFCVWQSYCREVIALRFFLFFLCSSMLEPVNSAKPKIPMTDTLRAYLVQEREAQTLFCPAQAFPVPAFRYFDYYDIAFIHPW